MNFGPNFLEDNQDAISLKGSGGHYKDAQGNDFEGNESGLNSSTESEKDTAGDESFELDSTPDYSSLAQFPSMVRTAFPALFRTLPSSVDPNQRDTARNDLDTMLDSYEQLADCDVKMLHELRQFLKSCDQDSDIVQFALDTDYAYRTPRQKDVLKSLPNVVQSSLSDLESRLGLAQGYRKQMK